MALTERYVSQAASGGDGTIGNPWTLSEAATHSQSNTGQRYNVLSDSAYSVGALMWGAGTVSAPNVVRGYDSSIGDLDNNGRNADGTLNTTGMPAITITSAWTVNSWIILQNLNITASLSSHIIGDTTQDLWDMIQCAVTNTANNAAAGCLQADDTISLTLCDLYCSGASHTRLLICDGVVRVSGCRFRITADTNCIEAQFPQIDGCLFWGNAAGVGVNIDIALDSLRPPTIRRSTFYGLDEAIATVNGAPASRLIIDHCHVTDCSKYIDNGYSATANITAIESYNRLRDITTPRTGVEAIVIGEIDTDAGDHTTDYEDADNGDFHLLTTAAGYNAGVDGSDIGAYQTDPPAGGSSGGGIRLAGVGGLASWGH